MPAWAVKHWRWLVPFLARPMPSLEERRRRAHYRAAHRGTREMDWLLGRYAEAVAPAMSQADLMDFERLCRRTAIGSASNRPTLGLLFLNASARAVEDPEWAAGGMDEILRKSGLAPHDVVVEITERVAIVSPNAARFLIALFGVPAFGRPIVPDPLLSLVMRVLDERTTDENRTAPDQPHRRRSRR